MDKNRVKCERTKVNGGGSVQNKNEQNYMNYRKSNHK